MADLDALTPEEELHQSEVLDRQVLEAETCVLQADDRILHDLGEAGGGFHAGKVVRLDNEGRVSVLLDGERAKKVSNFGSAQAHSGLVTPTTPSLLAGARSN